MSQIANFKKMVFDKMLPEFERHFKVKADYTPESLDKLQATLDSMYPPGTMARSTTLLSTGYYVGEVFVRNIKGAKWDEMLMKNNPYAVTFDMIKDGQEVALMVAPVEMVHDYIKSPVNSLSNLFRYYKEVAEGKRSIDDHLSGTAYTLYGGGATDVKV